MAKQISLTSTELRYLGLQAVAQGFPPHEWKKALTAQAELSRSTHPELYQDLRGRGRPTLNPS